MSKLRLIMRTNPAGVPIEGVEMAFETVAGTPLGTDTTGPDGFGEYSQDGSPGPILVSATYDGRTKYFDGRSLDQLGTIFVSDIPAMLRALGNGVIKGYTDPVVTTATDLALSPGTGRKITIAAGAYLLDGHIYVRSAAGDIDISANATGTTRYDRIVMQLDREASGDNEGRFVIAVKVGTTDPAGPALTSTAAFIEKSLGIIRVLNGATSFVSGDITDERSYALALPANIANGDILIVSGNAITRLPKSTDGKYLTLSSGLPAWGDVTLGVVVQEGDVTKVANCATIDFEAAVFDVVESPTGEANISIQANSIGLSKLATGVAPTFLGDGSVDATELSYLNGVTSAIQAQLDAKGTGNVAGQASSVDSEVALFSGTGGKTIKRSSLTASLVKSAAGVLSAAGASDLPTGIDPLKLSPGTVDATELGYLNGVTSSVQSQIDGKASSTHTHIANAAIYGEATVDHTAQNISTSSTTWGSFNLGPLTNGVTYDIEAESGVAASSSASGFIKDQIRIEAGGTVIDGMDTGTVDGERYLAAHTHKVVVGTGASINIAGRAQTTSGTGYVNSGLVWAKATPRLIPAP